MLVDAGFDGMHHMLIPEVSIFKVMMAEKAAASEEGRKPYIALSLTADKTLPPRAGTVYCSTLMAQEPLGPVTPAAHAGPALRAGRDAARTRRHCGSAGSSRRWCVATPRDVRLRGGRAP